jgi:hypothetical protein
MAFGDGIRKFIERDRAASQVALGKSQVERSRGERAFVFPPLTAKGRREAQLGQARVGARNIIKGTIRANRALLKKPVVTESDIPVIDNFPIPAAPAKGKFLPNTNVLKPRLVLKDKELQDLMRRKDI